jgi:ADP-ribosyl-[dinitrogen reductase] hydrolase
MLGTAVGDALGLAYEGLSPRRARRLLGPPDRHRFMLGRGMISDDTEHTCMVVESMIASTDDAAFENELARQLRNWVRLVPAGVGLATLRACLKLNLGVGPGRSGVYSAGNGPAMRSAIIGAAVDDIERLRKLVTVSTRITHTDPRADHGALAVALATRSAKLNQDVRPRQFIADVEQVCAHRTSQELLKLLMRAASSVERGESSQLFAQSIGPKNGVSGYVNHTVPVVVHAWWTHPHDFRAAVQSVILCGGDTDTTAAIVGGIVGATVGKDGIPIEWLESLWEWPRSLRWMEELARRLARVTSAGIPVEAPHLSVPCVLLRNCLFAAVVLAHGFRRLLPPY